MTQMDLFPTAIFSPLDTRANRLALLEIEEVKKMTDISGQKYLPLLKESDPLGQFSRMFMATSLWVSTKCFLIWKGQSTLQGRLLFRLLPVTHPTEETEFGLSPEIWPTPIASIGGASKNPNNPRGKHGGNPLATAVAMWPTPAARDYKGANGYERTKKKLENGERAQMGQLPNAVMMQEGKHISGNLNPQWVEWLMGYPEGWTDLED